MNDKETAAHMRRYVDRHRRHVSFSWPTDGCGYEQHVRYLDHGNKNWKGGDYDAWLAFVLAYADTLDPPSSTPDKRELEKT